MNKLDETILNTVVHIGDQIYTFQELVGIDPEGINADFVTQASRLAYLNMLTANAEAAHQAEKSHTERVYAKVELDWRDSLADKKTTEAQIKSLVIESDEYKKQSDLERTALLEYKLLKGLVEAMKERGSMLISLGANLRMEYDVTDLSIKQTKDRLRELANG